MRAGVTNGAFAATIILLLIVAASGYALYFIREGQASSTVILTSIGLSTETRTVTVVSASRSTGQLFNGTLIIMPAGVAQNQSLDFTPSTLKLVIGVNNTVTWINQDSLSQHTINFASVPSGAQTFSAILKTGETLTTAFTVPGTYRYFCMWHPGWMKGTITVISGH